MLLLVVCSDVFCSLLWYQRKVSCRLKCGWTFNSSGGGLFKSEWCAGSVSGHSEELVGCVAVCSTHAYVCVFFYEQPCNWQKVRIITTREDVLVVPVGVDNTSQA
jgi:hypothetical protein